MPEPPESNSRANTIWMCTAILALLGIVWFLLWFFYFRYHEWTDDAYTNANLININSPIPGSCVAFFADDTDLVVEGQLIVQLDTTEYQAAYDRELATLASVVLQVRQLYDAVKVARENVKIQKIEVSKTRFDYKNRLKLHGTGSVSEEDFIHSRDAFFSARTSFKQAVYSLRVALDARGKTKPEKHPMIQEQKGNVRTAYYNLKHCTILSPATGYVAQRAVDVGQWVTPTTNMMAIIPADYVWVDANYKETQLAYIRIGQPARVTLDIYGSKVEYAGKVLGIASGTGSIFSIIPPQNATGNWIKIVQRLPVRISLDPKQVTRYPTRLGLSAEVDVDISDLNLPMLAPAPIQKTVASTDVYNIHLEEVDKVMNDIVTGNLW